MEQEEGVTQTDDEYYEELIKKKLVRDYKRPGFDIDTYDGGARTKSYPKLLNDNFKNIHQIATFEWPFCTIGVIKIGKFRFVTGTLIFSNVVLTSANPFFDSQINEWIEPKEILFYLVGEENNSVKMFDQKEIKVIDYLKAQGYPKNKNEDFTVLILEREILKAGYMGIESIDIDKYKNNEPLNYQIFGHSNANGNYQDCNLPEKIQFDKDSGLLVYEPVIAVKEEKRFNGAPIYYKSDISHCYIIGIHFSDWEDNTIKKVIPMTMNKIDIINDYLNKNSLYFYTFIDQKLLDLSNTERINERNNKRIKLKSNELRYLTANGINFLLNISIDVNHLLSLYLNFNRIGTDGAELLSKGDLPVLKTLALSENEIMDQGVYFLTKGSFKNIEIILLSDNSLTKVCAEYIREAENFLSLKELDLNNNILGNEGVINISKAKLPKLNRLLMSTYRYDNLEIDIKIEKTGDKGVYFIAKESCFKELIELNMDNNNITVLGALYIKNHQILKNLQTLSLAYNNIADEGADAILHLEKLQYLYINNNIISDDGLRYTSDPKFINGTYYRMDFTDNKISKKMQTKCKRFKFMEFNNYY